MISKNFNIMTSPTSILKMLAYVRTKRSRTRKSSSAGTSPTPFSFIRPLHSLTFYSHPRHPLSLMYLFGRHTSIIGCSQLASSRTSAFYDGVVHLGVVRIMVHPITLSRTFMATITSNRCSVKCH